VRLGIVVHGENARIDLESSNAVEFTCR